jgi:hypothetical protein
MHAMGRSSRSARLYVAGTVAVVGVLALALAYDRISLRPEWSPWAALDIRERPNFLTRYKLSKLSHDREQCLAVLGTTSWRYEVLSDRQTEEDCGLHNAVRIDGGETAVGEPFSLTCRAAVSLALWERHVLQPAARAHFSVPVSRIEHFGSYSCRNVYGRPNATRSRHATAEALDIAGFRLADGREVRVLRDWAPDSEAARFLREVHEGACRFFDAVLGPGYNRAHRDHFHLDRGPYRVFR